MIGKLTGILSDKNPPQVVVDCGGVGYEVQVPMSTFYNLPATGEKVSLLTHFVVREDAQILYGFGSQAERSAFRELVKISGVGPRTALSVLSGMAVGELAQAITLQEAGRLTKVPGIGKKTAERLLLERIGGGEVQVRARLHHPLALGHGDGAVLEDAGDDALAVRNFDNLGWDMGELAWALKTWES